MEEKTRAFICIEFPESIIKEMARLQNLIEKHKFDGKLTELENLHLTLKFLGEVDNVTLEKVKERLSLVDFSEISLKLGEIGIFSHGKSPRIVWVKVLGEEVWRLQEKIDNALEDLFKKEERFMSHLTLARVKYVKDREGFTEGVRKIGVKDIEFKINRFLLKKSDLRESGPIYTTIKEFGSSELKKQ